MRDTIFFDLDQTLLDKHQSLINFANQQYKTFALDEFISDRKRFINEFVRLHHIVMPKNDVYRELTIRFSINASLQNEMLQDLDAHFPAASVGFPHLHEMLKIIKSQNYKIGLITNGRDFFQREKIKELGILPYLDNIVTSGGFGKKKPDLSIFKYGLGKLHATPKQSIFVGDSLTKDIVPAKSIGMRTIFMGPPQVHPDIDTNCLHLSEVPLAIERISK
ncbi:HAD family hydrolase [Alkalicoccobacillus murimartini]|uniref:Hydrolase of the HAD superfamily n=1 Tax=Alkalicoccobacillus murimartini TaxID=171685 RepID=A0ABT9YIJ3_9BACI|nr:HAD family hydrolase [Alkalicoccobacillus murimartini]MDQ0206864.1 putative hydrolase of the HAD superfamily [Alkalicoccobacillus murimartini]